MTGKSPLKAATSQDALSGLLFMAVAAGFAVLAQDLSLGTALRMGAGYFPLVLSGILGLFGFIIFVRAVTAGSPGVGAVSWRGLLLVTAAVLVFGLGLSGLGLGPTVAISTVLAASASGRVPPAKAALLAAFLVVFSWAVFILGLGLSIAMIGAWLA